MKISILFIKNIYFYFFLFYSYLYFLLNIKNYKVKLYMFIEFLDENIFIDVL